MIDIKKMVEEQRKERFNHSNQLSLGNLIEMLEQIPLRKDKDEQYVEFDFGSYWYN